MENSGEGKTYHKTPSQKRFWTPPPMIRFPPPVCFRPVVFLRGNRHRPGKSHFLRPPKLVLEGALYGTFPPQNRTIRFAPPLAAFQRFSPLARKALKAKSSLPLSARIRREIFAILLSGLSSQLVLKLSRGWNYLQG